MVIKILIGIVIYFLIIVLTCIFFKGATQIGNRFDEIQAVNKYLKKNSIINKS